jgi:argininosuccinate lyase
MSSDSQTNDKHKPWAGRFVEQTDAFVEKFTASIGFDRRLYLCDLEGSRAHARTLARAGIISAEECTNLLAGLDDIQTEIERGEFDWQIALEDVHMNIEARLVERLGEVGKKLHTGRSRNDQVATDLRLYLRGAIDAIQMEIRRLQGALLHLAETQAATIMPGFTHLQVAQPVTFGHHMMAWFEMLERDHARFIDCRKRVNIMPLGSAALAGTSYPLDRHYTAELLGFERPSDNSLDAVSDRDFAIEFCATSALVMTHLSRMAEELILWNSPRFRFVELPDRFCTGSSIMPQKKNPDVPELVRGKAGRVNGHLIALLTIMKAQPLAYNKDNQEDKEPIFDTVDTVHDCLRAFADMLPNIEVRKTEMQAAVSEGYATATDLADYLVRKGVAFRDAHAAVGQAVKMAIDLDKPLGALDLDALRALSPAIGQDVYDVLTPQGSVDARNLLGGTAPAQVHIQVEAARRRMNSLD